MKLSTATKAYERRLGTMQLRNTCEALTFLRDVGFEAVDLTFDRIHNPEFMLFGDDWEKKVASVAQTAAALGLEIYQCHTPYVSGGSLRDCDQIRTQEDLAYYLEILRRSMIAAGTLGVKWAVIHPLSFPELNFESKASQEENHRFFDEYVELGIRYGVGTAFENQLPSLNRKYPTRYCTHYEQLIDLVDSYHDPMVGICWDTGHANQMHFEQGRAIRAMGSRIKALHINDNHYGTRDEHLMPYMGEVDWTAVGAALAEVGYMGTLNYECKFTMESDGEIQKEMIRGMYRNACLLRELFEANV